MIGIPERKHGKNEEMESSKHKQTKNKNKKHENFPELKDRQSRVPGKIDTTPL